MTTEIALLWLPSLLISLSSLLVFVYLSYRNRQKIDELKQQTQSYSQQRVEIFLQREAQATRHRLKNSAATTAENPTHSIDKLRLTWLEAELTALVDQGKRRSNYDLLLHGVQPIARLINRPAAPLAKPAAPATAARPAQPAVAAQLQKARNTLTSQSEIIRQYRHKMAAAGQDAVDIQPSSGFTTALGTVEANTAELIATIARLEKELAALQHKFDASEQQTETALTHSSATNTPEFLIVTSPTSAGNSKQNRAEAARELLMETEQAYRQSVTEMTRMRDINSQQRLLIMQLEQELALVRKDTTQYEISSQMLDKLKLQLRDYETCTVILEKEADTLRDKVDALNKIITPNRNEEASANIAVATPRAPLNHSSDGQFDSLSMIGDIISAETPQAIVARLIEWLYAQKLSAVVFVRSESEQIWASSEGGVDSHSKQLMQSIQAIPDKPRLDVEAGILLAYPTCRVLIYESSRLSENAGELLQRLLLMTKIIDRWLSLMHNKPSIQPDTDLGELQEQLSGLLAQYSYISKEHLRVGEKFRTELDSFFSASGFTDVRQQLATTMLDDYDAQLEIIGKASKLIYTRLKAVVQDLEQHETLH